VANAVCVYVILTEIGSIIENLAVINPRLVPDKIQQILAGKEDKK
jgi:hypothetical protein